MVTFISHNPAETMALGETWGREALPGLVIGLTGDLGTGKTQLVKGIALGLGVSKRISSPTFALVNEYVDGRLPLAHLDLYRLDGPAHVLGAGLEGYFTHPDGVVVVEWIERWLGSLGESDTPHLRPRLYRQVLIECTDETTRRITYEDFGS